MALVKLISTLTELLSLPICPWILLPMEDTLSYHCHLSSLYLPGCDLSAAFCCPYLSRQLWFTGTVDCSVVFYLVFFLLSLVCSKYHSYLIPSQVFQCLCVRSRLCDTLRSHHSYTPIYCTHANYTVISHRVHLQGIKPPLILLVPAGIILLFSYLLPASTLYNHPHHDHTDKLIHS